MSLFTDIFQEIGLSKNEARIYETLLREGESPVGHISTKSEVYRRNVYDSLNRLIEKGLVFETIHERENRYQAVEPKKLLDMLNEKRGMLEDAVPQLESLYTTVPREYIVYTYRGKEGWKNYMRDILRVNKDVYFIGAKGGWLDKRIKDFFPYFIKEAKKQNITFHHLFDHEVQQEFPNILQYVGDMYKFLPPGYSTPSGIDIFGNQVNIITEIKKGELGEEIVFTVIVNQQVADSFRKWFQFMWDMLSQPTLKIAKKPSTAQKRDS